MTRDTWRKIILEIGEIFPLPVRLFILWVLLLAVVISIFDKAMFMVSTNK